MKRSGTEEESKRENRPKEDRHAAQRYGMRTCREMPGGSGWRSAFVLKAGGLPRVGWLETRRQSSVPQASAAWLA